MKNGKRATLSILSLVVTAAMGGSAFAQTPAAGPQRHPPVVASSKPPSEQEVADAQQQLLQLLRLSPTLTTVVAHDPSLLADQQYVQRNNPELAQFLVEHPDVAQNPDFYLFSNLNPHDARRDRALQRAVWPEFAVPEREPSTSVMIVDKAGPALGFVAFFFSTAWVIRLFVDSRRWTRAFRLQSDVHAKLIDKFTNSQELAAYMETEAGKKFLEGVPVQTGLDASQRMPNAVARILTPMQIGVVMALLGAGLLALRHAGPDTYEPMLVLGMIVLMPGVGFILSAGATWVLARRLGMLPEGIASGARE
jgi:hypothetical protein